MQSLPVIVGFGGMNAGGRSSFNQSYRRTVFESLTAAEQQQTITGLACMMKLVRAEGSEFITSEGQKLSSKEVDQTFRQKVLDGTLVRAIESTYFDTSKTPWNKSIVANTDSESVSFITTSKQLPDVLPENWQVEQRGDKEVKVTVTGEQTILVETVRDFQIKSAGQLPSGFDPAEHYNSRFQPRALQMAIMGASDAVKSVGIPWQQILQSVPPDQMGVYASSVFGQMGEEGFKGLLASRYRGGRPSSKSVPMSLNTMPADFLNAYVLGSLGHTEAVVGACASFLYNLRSAVDDIKFGKRRIAIVGGSEAPIDADLIEGFANMNALATADGLAKLDGVTDPDLRKASRPFGNNCGFTIGESVQYIVLMDDALALELGCDIFGAATDVFINADGIKKSISGPGAGNYITFAKAVAAAQAILGKESVATRSMIQAHGSSTPQNRVTESHIFHLIAEKFGIENWPVAAVKAFFGHPQATASADQFTNTLGIFQRGIIPGIKTMDAIAEDVYDDHLVFPLQDLDVGKNGIDCCFINAKGFGGNNATGVLVSPQVVERMMEKRYGQERWAAYCQLREGTRQNAKQYEAEADRGDFNPYYRFGEDMVDEQAIELNEQQIVLPGYKHAVSLAIPNPYDDMV